jgi:hypothetical protein
VEACGTVSIITTRPQSLNVASSIARRAATERNEWHLAARVTRTTARAATERNEWPLAVRVTRTTASQGTQRRCLPETGEAYSDIVCRRREAYSDVACRRRSKPAATLLAGDGRRLQRRCLRDTPRSSGVLVRHARSWQPPQCASGGSFFRVSQGPCPKKSPCNG